MTTKPAAPAPVLEEHGELVPRSLQTRALRGTYYVVIFYGVALGLRLVSSVVLSRLFLPQFFGLMALITTVIVGLNLFSHMGVQDSIIQNARGDDPAFLNTGWTLQVIRGAGIWALSFPLALPVARFYHEPEIVALLPVLGFTCLVAGFSSPSLLTLTRHLGVGRLSALEVLTQFVQFVVTLAWAFIQPTIWALVGGRVVAELVRTALSYRLMPEIRPHFRWEKEALREIVKFGRWILLGTALTFLAMQSDRLILAKLVSFRMLGVYGIAFSLSDLPRQIILQFCNRVGFPFLAKSSGNPRAEFRKILLKYRMPVLAVGGLMIIGVICVGDAFILHVYTKPYWGAAWMISILALGLWHTMLYSTTTPAVLALQKSHYNAIAYLAYCIALYTALPLGYHWLGMVGAVIAIAASDLPMYFVTVYSAQREGVGTLRQDVWMTAAFLSVLALVLGVRSALGFGLPLPHMR